jgi:hypothetical protein
MLLGLFEWESLFSNYLFQPEVGPLQSQVFHGLIRRRELSNTPVPVK